MTTKQVDLIKKLSEEIHIEYKNKLMKIDPYRNDVTGRGIEMASNASLIFIESLMAKMPDIIEKLSKE